MRQAIHIFKKDVRGLWYQIVLTIVVVAVFVFLDVRTAKLSEPMPGPDLIGLFLILAWWILIARVIQCEALAGDRQFWCTRPYAWTSLLTAKALFIFAFVNLPIFTADAVIIHVFGFSTFAELPGLIWSQVLLTTIVILPMTAIAAVANGLTQLLSTTFFIGLVLFAFEVGVLGTARPGAWGSLDWIRASVALVLATAATASVIVCQYEHRKTVASRVLLAATCMLVVVTYTLFPWTAAFGIQGRLSRQRIDPRLVQITFDSGQTWLTRASAVRGDRVQINIPLQVTNVPAGMGIITDGISVNIEAPGQAVWRSTSKPWRQVNSEAGITSLQTVVDGSFYRRIRNEAVNIHGQMYLTLSGHSQETSVPIENRPVSVPGGGVCLASRQAPGVTGFIRAGGQSGSYSLDSNLKSYILLCRSAFRSPPNFVSVSFENSFSDIFREPISYSPFPAALSLSPVSQYFAFATSSSGIPAATLTVTEPIAFIRREFEISDIRLRDFEVRPGGVVR